MLLVSLSSKVGGGAVDVVVEVDVDVVVGRRGRGRRREWSILPFFLVEVNGSSVCMLRVVE